MNYSHRARSGLRSSAAVALRALVLLTLLLLTDACVTAPTRDQGLPADATPVDSGATPDRGKARDVVLTAKPSLPAGSLPPVESGTPHLSGPKADLGAVSGTPAKKIVPAHESPPADTKGAARANTRVQAETAVALREEGEVRLLPEEGPGFWEAMMTPDVAWEYRAINGVSQCTRFVADMLDLYFGHDAYLQVFPTGVNGANETFFEWVENHDLVRLPPDQYTIQEIQALANQGYLILMAYYFPDIAGHVAFVGHKELKLFTIPALDGLEGKNGASLGRRWLPVMVQAGTYTGITSMVYATNGWLRNDNFGKGIVRYYFVRSGAELPDDISLE